MSLQWIPFFAHHDLPSNAVQGGRDSDGSTLYVIRANHEKAMVPGKFSKTHLAAYIPYGNKEHSKKEFYILTGNGYRWVNDSNGHVPNDAFEGGADDDGETLFIARAHFENTITPGKVHPSHKTAFLSYAGKEHRVQNYEVLCLTVQPSVKAQSIATSSYSTPLNVKQSDDGNTACVICMMNQREFAYNKCHHFTLCHSCVDVLRANQDFRCITCRQQNTDFTRIFL